MLCMFRMIFFLKMSKHTPPTHLTAKSDKKHSLVRTVCVYKFSSALSFFLLNQRKRTYREIYLYLFCSPMFLNLRTEEVCAKICTRFVHVHGRGRGVVQKIYFVHVLYTFFEDSWNFPLIN